MTFSRIKVLTLYVCTLLALTSFPGYVDCANKKGSQAAAAPPAAPIEPEAVIEEVNAKQLEKLLTDKDYVAVFWYARSCLTCDKVLAELEKIDDDTDSFGVDFVKINDKRLAKQYGIQKFPALTYFREKEPIIYDGDLMDEEGVLDFLTSLEAMDLPDRIEEVNSKILLKIIEDTDFVAVLFCPDHETCPSRAMDKPQCRKCAKALQELENIDDEADQLGIGFVKIHDEALADEYNLGNLPALVYYRHQTPIIYEGELSREEDVLEWLVQNKSTGDEDDVIEDVTAKTLSTLISNIDNLVVLFYDHGNDDSMTVLEELEQIDDDCDKHGIQFVKIDDPKAADDYGIDTIPAIVYFEKQIPNIYDGDLMDEDQILHWLVGQLEHDEIEDVTDEMLDKMVKEGRVMAVLFYDNNDKKSQKVLEELENIDDECDALGVTFVKIDNPEEAVEYGINKVPKLIYFEKGIPTIYEGNLEDEEKLLKWLEEQTTSDQIEDITDEMMDLIIEKMPYVAVLYYDKDQKKSQKVLAELENIDDECDQNDIAFVKIDDDSEAKEWGIDALPAIVFFERGIPHIYEGDLMKEDELLGWLVHQKRHSEIPEVTDEMKDKLIENTEHLAVIFYDKDDKQDIRVLNELENIDDELEKEGIVIVRIDNAAEAKEYGLDHLPALIYFENKIPALYEGDLMNEDEVLEWLILQKRTATIEEVTDEILTELISDHEYVVVFFTGPCELGEKCDKTLSALESIDDELDEAGIIFVTTEDTNIAKKHNIKNYPQLVFFRNRDPLVFTGDLDDEDEVLSWITDEDTLEIPGKIEEVNSKMLDKILSENDHVVVFFYQEGDKRSQKILNELENIDDECEEKDIDFIKTSDPDIDKEYDLASLPALAFYRHKFRTIYDGDLMKEDEILDWVIDLHESTSDVIESVDRKTLQVLINDVEHLAVFFYDDKCQSCPQILEELETIDDDTDKHGIQFVKSNDVKLAHEIGIFAFPALVYYETGVPIMYDGNLKNENRVLQWLINQKSEEDEDDEDEEDDDDDNENENDRKIKYRARRAQRNKRSEYNDDDDDEDDDNDDDDEEDDGEDNNDDNDETDDEDDNDNDNGNDDDDDYNENDEDDEGDEDDDDEDEDEDDDEITKLTYPKTDKSKEERLRRFHKNIRNKQKSVDDDEYDEDDDDGDKKYKLVKRRVFHDDDVDDDEADDDDDDDNDDERDESMRVHYRKPGSRRLRFKKIVFKSRLIEKDYDDDDDDDDDDEDDDEGDDEDNENEDDEDEGDDDVNDYDEDDDENEDADGDGDKDDDRPKYKKKHKTQKISRTNFKKKVNDDNDDDEDNNDNDDEEEDENGDDEEDEDDNEDDDDDDDNAGDKKDDDNDDEDEDDDDDDDNAGDKKDDDNDDEDEDDDDDKRNSKRTRKVKSIRASNKKKANDDDDDKDDDDDEDNDEDDDEVNDDNDDDDDEDENNDTADEDEEDDEEDDENDGEENEDENDDDDDKNDEDEKKKRSRSKPRKKSQPRKSRNNKDDDDDDDHGDNDDDNNDEDDNDEDDDNNDNDVGGKNINKNKNAKRGKDDDDDDNDDKDNDDDDNDDDDEEDNDDDQHNKRSRKTEKAIKPQKIHQANELCSKRFIDKLDDECFYVGLGHDGGSARRGNNYAPNAYKPFQCCPTKLEKSTKVPKMTAQRIGHSVGDATGKRSAGTGSATAGNFQFGQATTGTGAGAAGKSSKVSYNKKEKESKKRLKRVNDDEDDDEDEDEDDDDDGNDDVDAPMGKVSYTTPRKSAKKSGNNNKKQQVTNDRSYANVKSTKKASAKDGDKLNVKTGYLSMGIRKN